MEFENNDEFQWQSVFSVSAEELHGAEMPSPKTIQSTVAFTDPQNNPVANGLLVLDLSQAAEVASGGGQVVPKRVSMTLTSTGVIPNSTTIWANDQLTPSGTTYHAHLYDAGGNLLADFGQWSITGSSPIDLSQMTPTTAAGASYPAPVLLSPSGQQTINGGDLVMEGASLGLSASGSTIGDSYLNRISAGVIGAGTSDSNSAGTYQANSLKLNGASSGATILAAASSAGGTATLPNNTGTIAELNLAQTWTQPQAFGSNSITAGAFISNSSNPASSGVVELASADAVKWRNSANSADIALQKTGAASGNVPADSLDASGFGAVKFTELVSATSNPASAGQIAMASADSIKWRNNANSADIAMQKTGASSSSATADTLDLSGFGSVKTAGIIGSGFQKQIYTSGSGTFTIPTGITQVKVTVVGGGGAGCGGTSSAGGNGGGSGGCAIKWLTGLTPGNTLNYSVGAGGTGVSGANGNSGSNSSVSSGTQSIGTITGGGGIAGATNGTGYGGSASGGDLNLSGNWGTSAISTTLFGFGAGSIFGGAPTTFGGSPGQAAGAGGNGNTGGSNTTGGNGSAGIVIFEWIN